MKYVPFKFISTFFSLLYAINLHGQVQIDGLYATTTALPLAENAIQNVFDGDLATYWKTPDGAGPDEGIMIYFSEPTYISKIEITNLNQDGISKIKRFEIYGDGQTFWGSMEPKRELESLYIKIASTNGT